MAVNEIKIPRLEWIDDNGNITVKLDGQEIKAVSSLKIEWDGKTPRLYVINIGVAGVRG